MTPLPPGDARKVRGALGLLLSDKDGERLAAVDAVVRLLGKSGISVVDLMPEPTAEPDVQPNPWRPSARPFEARVDDHNTLANALLRASLRWTAWEREFLQSVGRKRSLSAKEKAKLKELHREVVG